MSDKLIDYLEVDAHFTRSISIARDLQSEAALDGYQLTPAVASVLTRIGHSIQGKSPQRAWKIIGPYGSGKSALGLMLANLLTRSNSHNKAMALLKKSSPEITGMFQAAGNCYPLAVTGSRTAFGLTLAAAIRQSIEDLHTSGRKPNVYHQLDLEKGTYRDEPIASAITPLLSDFIAFVKGKGFDGALLIIDELGKFIEYAAAFPDQADLFAFQQVAEAASGDGNDHLYVVGLLHQHLEQYAADVGRKLSDEWSKVAARFEEIVFDEPVEQYAYFAASALQLDKAKYEALELLKLSADLHKAAMANGFFRPDAAMGKALQKVAHKIYPLHPAVIASLAVISKRYGQSERSFHSFLRGNETHGLIGFAKGAPVDHGQWYTLSQLFDYLTQGVTLRFRSLEVERRWDFAQSIIDRNPTLDTLDIELLKTIAVLELSAPFLGVHITESVLEFCLKPNAVGRKKLSAALVHLVEKSLLMKRHSSGEFAFPLESAVNIEGLYEKAGLSLGNTLLTTTGAQRLLVERRIVASRHYQKTGTIRTMSVFVCTTDAEVAMAKHLEHLDSEGVLIAMLVPDSDPEITRAKKILTRLNDARALGTVIPVDEDAGRSLEALSRWMLVYDGIKQQRIDPWTENYVELKLQEARQSVEKAVLSRLMPSNTDAGSNYYHMGHKLGKDEALNVNQAASWLFDNLYPNAPIIHNELINRDRLSTQIVLARQRLIENCLSHESEALLGMSGFPPERLIYATLIQNTGLHSMAGGDRWTLTEPDENSPPEIQRIWALIGYELRGPVRPTFGAMVSKLALPPIGLRSGPASIFLAVYLLVNSSRCALFERGTLVLATTTEHFARMFKNPEAFELREFEDSAQQGTLLHQYASALATIGASTESSSGYLDIARNLVLWYTRLSDYAKETVLISSEAKRIRAALKKATDPVALLTRDLPRATSGEDTSSEHLLRANVFTKALAEIGSSERRLRDEIVQALGQAFGINGPIRSIRTKLQEECAAAAAELSDFRLRSFLLRCADVALTDDKWLESIASLVAKRPLESWNDQTILEFREELEALAGRYKRWLGVVMQKGRHQEATQRFLGVTLTTPQGEEESVLVTTSEESNRLAEELLQRLLNERNDRSLVTSVLAQAFVKMQHSSTEEGDDHGREQAS